MTEYVSHGDHRRSMALLWGKCEAPTRGPKQALTVPEIVAAAIELADSEGIAAVSMRKVADRLGRSPMSLYTYVPGKAELLDVMLDTAYGEIATDYPYDQGWRAAAEASARSSWAFYERHPWVLQIAGARALLGPHEMDLYEAQLRIFDGLGLSGRDMSRIVTVIGDFVGGAASSVRDARLAPRTTGVSDDDWWTERSALLDEMVAPETWGERWPTVTAIGDDHAFDQLERDPEDDTPYLVWELLDSFEFGLQRLLDGLERYIETRTPRTPRTPPGAQRP